LKDRQKHFALAALGSTENDHASRAQAAILGPITFLSFRRRSTGHALMEDSVSGAVFWGLRQNDGTLAELAESARFKLAAIALPEERAI
jgi:hypothetical protein